MRYYYLTPVPSSTTSPRYGIGDREFIIGRSHTANISFVEPTISRRHATIQVYDGTVILKDLDSKHGTFVNSKRISNAKLKVGDIVVFGLSLVLRLEETDQPIAPSSPGPSASTRPRFASSHLDPDDEPHVTAVRTIRLPTGISSYGKSEVTPLHVPEIEILEHSSRLTRLSDVQNELASLCNQLKRFVHDNHESEDLFAILFGLERVYMTINEMTHDTSEETVKTRCKK